jgi:hypothetical protein
MYPLRVVHDLRPALSWTIYSLPIAIERDPAPAVQERRFAIQWDEDNDERILAAVLDVYFRRPSALSNLYAAGERKGSVTIWAAEFALSDQHAWAAATKGPAISDSWSIESISAHTEITRTGGRQRTEQSEDVIARKFSSAHDELNWLIKLFDLGPSGPHRPW